jgi:tyrosine-protein kinase Etk/Wzc
MASEVSLPELKEHAPGSRLANSSAKFRQDDEISLLDLIIVLAERKQIIFKITIAFALIAGIISLLLPKMYTATVTLLPPQQGSSMSAALASQLGSLGGMAALAGGGLGLKNPNDMYVAMLKSNTVEDAMIQHYGLMQEYKKKYLSDARKAFEKYATVDGNGKDGLIHISVEDRDPHRAADMANGYVDQYRHLSENLAITEAGQRRLFFQQQLEQAKNNLETAEENLKVTEQKTGLIQVNSQATALIEAAASIRAQITAKEVQIQAMQTYATGQNAELVQAQQELDSLRAQLARLSGSEEAASGLIVPKGKIPEAGLEYMRKMRDVQYYETIFNILARQFELAKLDEAKEGALIQVVDPALPPDRRSSPKRTLIVLVAIALGLFFGILAALWQAAVARLKSDPETAAKLSLLRRLISFRRAHVPQGPTGASTSTAAR